VLVAALVGVVLFGIWIDKCYVMNEMRRQEDDDASFLTSILLSTILTLTASLR